MRIFLPHAAQHRAPRVAFELQVVQHILHNAEQGHAQAVIPGNQAQTLRRKREHLSDTALIHRAETFQTGLSDLPEAARGLGHAEDVFIVIELLHLPGRGAGGAHDGERHVRL